MKLQKSQRMNGFSPFFVMELLQRAKELEKLGNNIIHMEIGESDMPTPAEVIKAGLKFLEKGEVKYTPAAGLPELRSKVVDYYQQTYAVDLSPERIFYYSGCFRGFFVGSRCRIECWRRDFDG